MSVLKKYNSTTGLWEAVAVGASGATGTSGYSYVATTTYTTNTTLGSVDVRALILVNSASSTTITIPQSLGVTGDTITLVQYGAGQIVVAPASGVTLRNNTTLKSRAQYSVITAIKLNTDEWLIAGDTAII
jgi:hypothetical protein